MLYALKCYVTWSKVMRKKCHLLVLVKQHGGYWSKPRVPREPELRLV
jgi:hypothetical protein